MDQIQKYENHTNNIVNNNQTINYQNFLILWKKFF